MILNVRKVMEIYDKNFIKTKKKNWNLTKEDFEEAKKEFKK